VDYVSGDSGSACGYPINGIFTFIGNAWTGPGYNDDGVSFLAGSRAAVAAVLAVTGYALTDADISAFTVHADTLAGISFALRLQTHKGDKIPFSMYQDTACTIPATLAGEKVKGWKDELSGSGLIATQTDSTKAPTLQFSAGGVPVLLYDNVNDAGLTGLSITSGDYSIHTGYRWNNSAYGAHRVVCGSNNWLIGPYNGQHQFYNQFGFVRSGSSTDADTPLFSVVTVDRDTAGSELWVNGVSTATNATNGYPGTLYLGVEGPFPESSDSSVVALIVRLTSGANTQRATIDTYISSLF
jgi:hypothetical protein